MGDRLNVFYHQLYISFHHYTISRFYCQVNIHKYNQKGYIMFIYVIGTRDKQKIGISKDVNRRLKSLQTGNPEILNIHHTIQIEPSRVRLLERMIHKEFSYMRLKGEWFDMTPEKAVNLVKFSYIAWNEDPLLEYKV